MLAEWKKSDAKKSHLVSYDVYKMSRRKLISRSAVQAWRHRFDHRAPSPESTLKKKARHGGKWEIARLDNHRVPGSQQEKDPKVSATLGFKVVPSALSRTEVPAPKAHSGAETSLCCPLLLIATARSSGVSGLLTLYPEQWFSTCGSPSLSNFYLWKIFTSLLITGAKLDLWVATK